MNAPAHATVFDITWALQSMTGAQQESLFQLLDDRIQKRSTIATAQMPVEPWHETMPNPTLADASSTGSSNPPTASSSKANPCANDWGNTRPHAAIKPVHSLT